jgi:glycosyltransferase involved in cell wall biosynthesis
MKLTIGIPTFNRYDKLYNTLEQILKQLSNFEYLENLEILISNNASTDKTNFIVEDFNKLVTCSFNYYIQAENIGFDRNVDFLFRKASGDFLWILSDDDILLENAITDVYKSILLNPKIVFAFINYNVNVCGKLVKSNLLFKENIIISSEEIMTTINFANSLISSCIFNVYKWNEIKTELFFDTYWIHMYVARSLLKEGKSLIITRPLIEMQQQNFLDSRSEKQKINGIEFYFYAHLQLVEFCESLLKFGYPLEIQRKAKIFCEKGDIGHIINLKLFRKFYDIKEIIIIIFSFIPFRRKKISFYLFFIPLLLLPGTVFKILYFFKNYKKNEYKYI